MQHSYFKTPPPKSTGPEIFNSGFVLDYFGPKLKSHRNEPRLLPWILGTLAACRNEHPEQLAATTTRNAKTFFRLP